MTRKGCIDCDGPVVYIVNMQMKYQGPHIGKRVTTTRPVANQAVVLSKVIVLHYGIGFFTLQHRSIN